MLYFLTFGAVLPKVEECSLKEIRLEARLRNNMLWHIIFEHCASVSEFCQKNGNICNGKVGELLNLKGSPFTKAGEYRKICIRLAEIGQMLVEDLFPLRLYNLPQTTLVKETSFTELAAGGQDVLQLPAETTPYDTVVKNNLADAIKRTLDTLTPREEDVIRRRFGLPPYDDEQALEEIAQDDSYLVTKDWIRQIEAKALRKLRRPSRVRRLKSFAED